MTKGLRFCAALILAACTNAREGREPAPPGADAAAHVADHLDEPEHAELPRRVRLTPALIDAARIVTAPVARGALTTTVALPGEIAADPDKSARVASPIAGRIESVSFREGSAVKKGELLAVIRVPDLGRLRTTLATNLAVAKAARANADRLKELAQKRLTPEQSYLDAVAAAESSELGARAASEQIAALGLGAGGGPSQLGLRAPLSGVVIARSAVVGQPVTADEVIAEIVDLSELWFLGRVFEKDLGRLALNAAVEVQLNAYPKEHFRGHVDYIGRQVDPSARTVTARIRLTNRDDLLRIGLFGSAYVSTDEQRGGQDLLLVPRSAITEVAGKPVVFVRQADGDFELHTLTLGDAAGGQVQVALGLREGEQVVVDGVFTLKSAVLKATFAEEE